jgi:integrase/recombinase XerD
MDPAEPLLAPRPDMTLPETLHASELVKLLESIDVSQHLGRRDLAILELFYASGLRLSELCKVRLEMMDFEEGFIRITGKGGKTRIVRVGNKARDAVSNYLANERPDLVTQRTSSHIFLSVRGGALSPDRVRQIVKERAKMAGIDQNVYPHLLRHSFATARRWRGPAGDSRAARPCRYIDHADLHPRRSAATQEHSQEIPPTRVTQKS